jgi:hypothetical protein
MVTKKEVGREEHSNSGFVWHCGDRGGGILQARTFGARTRTFCSVPEHFVPCTNKMYFFNTFLNKNNLSIF